MASKKATQAEESTAIVRVHQSLLALQNAAEIRESVKENLGTRGVSRFDLQSIQPANGGVPLFVVKDALEGESNIKAFEGVAVFWNDYRAFWQEAYGADSGEPPDCQSADMLTGYGSIGQGDSHRTCKTCPMNQWGSAASVGNGHEDSKSKACKESRAFFVLRTDQEENLFPSLLKVTAGGLKQMTTVMFQLAGRGIPYHKALFRFSVEIAKGAFGPYGTVKIEFVRRLNDEEAAAVLAYSKAMKAAFVNVDPFEREPSETSAEAPGEEQGAYEEQGEEAEEATPEAGSEETAPF